MFIRKTIKKDRKTGKTYPAFYLVESIRTSKGPRIKILLYMGSSIDLPEEDHKLLAQRIQEIVSGQSPLLPCSARLERLASEYASLLVHRLSEEETRQSGETQEELPQTMEDFATVDINSIEHSEPRTVGAEHLLLTMAHQLQLPKKLRWLGLSETEVALALGTIIGRATHPASERETRTWLRECSGSGELLDYNFKKLSKNRLYQISDKLLSHKDKLEAHLKKVEQHFHGYHSSIALYDLTNTYMEGQAKKNRKAAHGPSKEKRNDCPLVTLGLVMNEHGFLSRTAVFPGNASEAKTMAEMINGLDRDANLCKPIVILDAGISSEANLKWLRDNNYKYIVSARQDAPSTEIEGELQPVGDIKDFVKAAYVKNPDGDEKWLHCESEAKAATATQMKQSFRRRFEEDLQKLASGIAKPRGRKKYAKVLERLGRLKEKHLRISGCYEIEVVASEDGQTAVSIKWSVVDEKINEKLTGKYFLRTNLTDKGPAELWQLYNALRGVEEAFRFMKSSLGLRPVYHQKEYRVDGHLWITVLAYHLIHNCLYQLGKQGINFEWKTVRRVMGSRVRVTTQAKTIEGTTMYQRSTTKAEGEQLEIYKALGLSPQILKTKKMVF